MGKDKGFCDFGFAKVDTGRHLRRGFPEVIYCPGKETEHIKSIAGEILRRKQDLLLTRLEEPVYLALKECFPGLRYNRAAKLAYLTRGPKRRPAKGTVLVISAGMEGALSSLVSGIVACPVIAVPTSCGYGASFGGLSALLTMLNGCSPGVTVVNIDNGFGAGYFASRVLAKRSS